MPRKRKITPAVLEQIPTLLDQGVSPPEIARMVGCTLGTLRVMCSKYKISLRQNTRAQSDAPRVDQTRARHSVSRGARRASGNHHQTMTLDLPKATAVMLRRQADGKGLSVSTLAVMLLETIVQDGLYDAVLDDSETSKRPPGNVRALDATPARAAATEERKNRLNKRHAA